MAAARPLEMTVGRDGRADVHLGPRPRAARASYSLVETPEAPPYAWNGRLFVRPGRRGRLLLGDRDRLAEPQPRPHRRALRQHRAEERPPRHLVDRTSSSSPASTSAPRPTAPSSSPARRARCPGWTREGNPDFDLGAFLTEPNAEGVGLDDAVGGGARIVTDLGRKQRFETFGYPGGTERMRTCLSGYAGQDPITTSLPGPPTVGDPLPLGPRGERRRLADRRRPGDRRHHHLPAHRRQAAHLRPLLRRRNRRPPRRRPLTRSRAGGGRSGSRGGRGAGSRRAPGGGGRRVCRRSCSARVRGRSARSR